MSQTDTAEMRRLWEAATKGEWYTSPDGFIDVPVSRTKAKQVCRAEKQNDAEYIAAAHNALPALLDELEAARAELEALKVPLAIYERHTKAIGAAEELEQSAKTLREDLADMNPPEFASRGKVAPGYCECLQDVADGMEERAAKLRQEVGE